MINITITTKLEGPASNDTLVNGIQFEFRTASSNISSGSLQYETHVITTGANAAFSVYAADVDGDGDMDVLSASANDAKIAWYDNDGNQNFTADTITTGASGASCVRAARHRWRWEIWTS